MELILSRNRMNLRVDAIAEAGLGPDQIPENTLGILDVTTGKTVAPASFDELPEAFRIINKVDGKLQFGFDCIHKNDLVWAQHKEYVAPKVEKWEGVIDHCSCLKSVRLNLWYQDPMQNMYSGIPWGATDTFVEVSPEEFKCYCSCEGNNVYEQNVMTMLIYKKILERGNTESYKASVATEDGAQTFANLKEVEEFVKANKAVNTNKEEGDNGKKLKLIIEGLMPTHPKRFNHYNIDYAHARGTNLLPGFQVNGEYVAFKKIEDMVMEIGSGYDLVYQEYMDWSYSHNELTFPVNRMEPVSFMEFSFDESKKYDTVTLEFDSKKYLRAGKADKKRFMLMFGSEVGKRTDVFDKLKEIFKFPAK